MTNGTSDFTRSLARRLHRLLPATRRARRGLALCSLLVVGPALFASLPVGRSPADTCDAMKRWASRYAGTSPTLEEIAPFTRAQRVAIFNAVSPAVRASLWQEQLRRFNQQPDLTAEQHALIEEGLSLTTVALYEQRPEAVRAHRLFVERAKKAFVSIPHRRAWIDLGSVVPSAGVVNAETPSLLEKLVGPFRANASFAACRCMAPFDPIACATGNCASSSCSTTQGGCDWNGMAPCDGMCV